MKKIDLQNIHKLSKDFLSNNEMSDRATIGKDTRVFLMNPNQYLKYFEAKKDGLKLYRHLKRRGGLGGLFR